MDIIYQDTHYIAVNKPAGLLVYRSAIDHKETRFALQMIRDRIGRPVYPVHRLNWLRVLGTAETPQIDQGVSHQFHAVVPPLDVFETDQQSLEFILPRKRPFHAIP